MSKYPLLIETGCEDLPPQDVRLIEKTAAGNLSAILKDKRIEFSSIKVFVTVRRIGIIVNDISSHQAPHEEKVKGPPYEIAFKDGKPAQPAKGFASKMKVKLSELTVEDTPRGKYLFCVKKEKGLPVRDMLKEIVVEFLKSFSFPVTMRWPGYEVRFPRPIRWLLVRMGKTSVKIGLGSIKSGRSTRGHYLFADKKAAVNSVEDYDKVLQRNYIVGDPGKRREVLKKAIERPLKYTSGYPVIKEELFEEINSSVEFPTGIRGKFDEKYLQMPREIIEACLVHHQRYFPVEDREGNLLNEFVGVRDGISENLETVRKGYERVLVARLEDAEFFLEIDRKHSLEEHVEKLKGIEFTRGMGTLYDKVRRCMELSGTLSDILGKNESFREDAVRITFLSKADLSTHMVEEFPELEGLVGKIYAEKDGEKKKVSQGILDQYKPRTFEDELPGAEEAAASAAADRIDTLCGNLASGVEATGSQDPFGLRRTCRGLLRILTDRKWDVDLNGLIKKNIKLYNSQGIKFDSESIEKILQFISVQLRQYTEEEFSYDIARCVLNNNELNPALTFERARAVEKIKKSKGFDSLVTAFKRAGNILKQARDKKISIPDNYDGRKLKEEAEKELGRKYRETSSEVTAKIKERDFYGALKILASLRAYVDRFFDDVLVMDPDEELMKNRLAMLNNIMELFSPAGDISRLETK